MVSTTFPPVPIDTCKAAQTIFRKGSFYLEVGDHANDLFTGLFQDEAQKMARDSDWSPAMFYLITVFQFIESLPDFQAVDLLNERVDWKFALHLPLNYLSLDATELCKFRQGLRANRAALRDFQTLLQRLPETSGFGRYQPHNQEAGQAISMVCLISRLGKIWEAINQVLEVLAIRWPEWLLANSLPHWYERYTRDSRNLNLNTNILEAQDLALGVGADSYYLLDAIFNAGKPQLAGLLEVRTLRRVLLEEFDRPGGKVIWKREFCAGCSSSGNLSLQSEDAVQEK